MQMTRQRDSGGPWERVAAELRTCRDAQRQAWGNLDDITVARYLAGACSPQERAEVEQAARSLPDVRDLIEVLRAAMPVGGADPVAQTGLGEIRGPTVSGTPRKRALAYAFCSGFLASALLVGFLACAFYM